MNEVDQEIEVNPALDFVNALQVGNFNNAEELFKDMLGDKVQQSLDAEKVSVADQIFNGVEEEDIEVTDEEVSLALDNDSHESESEVE